MIELRDYQETIIEKLRESYLKGNRRVILCSPTGSGKTVVFNKIVSDHQRRKGQSLILTHRKELLSQTSETFKRFNLNPDLITAKAKPDLTHPLHVAMVETFDRRMKDYLTFLQTRSMIVIDEAHLESFTKIFQYINPNTFVIGATATPYRKANQNCLSEFYQDLIQEIDTPELIERGYLSKAISYGVQIETKKLKKVGDDYDTKEYYTANKTYEGVVWNYKRRTPNEKAILFASNVESSKQVCNEFISNGIPARHVDGKTLDSERVEIFDWFDRTPNAVLCNCGITTAGFDQPDIKVVILYLATTSLTKFLQMCGRGSRIAQGKFHFTILDFGNNISRHGYWENPRVWSLYKQKKKVKGENATPMKSCKECEALIPMSTKVCPFCGAEYDAKERGENEFAELILLTDKQRNKIVLTADLRTKVAMCKMKLVKPFYVLHSLENYDDAVLFCKMMGYKDGFIHHNKDRFEVFRNGYGG